MSELTIHCVHGVDNDATSEQHKDIVDCLLVLIGVAGEGGNNHNPTFLLDGALIHALLIGGNVDLLLRHSCWLHGGHLLGRWLVRVLHLDLGSWSEHVRVVRRLEGE